MARILIIDDDDAFRAAFAETLADLGHDPIEASSGKEGLATIAEASPAAVFLDYKMAGMDGLELLHHLNRWPGGHPVPVVMLTAFASSTNTIEAMKLGAFEHLTKPITRSNIEKLLVRLLSTAGNDTTEHEANVDRLIGNSPAMREVHKLIGRAAATTSTVLITGETGTGKELVARLIHDSSDRARQPFVAVNCAAIPRELLESELFGHVKGAFTGAIANRTGSFQQADGGTLMLDEIGDMSMDMQAKLLRVLEERTLTPVGGNRPERLDLRVVAATHGDLGRRVADQKFREDLYFRLNVLPIHIPALRDRPSDVVVLARHFLSRVAAPRHIAMTLAATNRLTQYHWPGNVRELRNAIERVSALVKGTVIDADDLGFLSTCAESSRAREFDPALLEGDLNIAIAALERSMIWRAIEACGGNRAEAARRLGIHRQLLYAKLRKYGLLAAEVSNETTPPVREDEA
jgi:DNA-binding NtrC family response regulator